MRTSSETVGEGARLSDVERAAWFGLLERHRLSLVEHTVLHLLRTADGRMRMSELAGSALLSPSGVSRLVDRLVAAGHIERTAWRHDGRAIYAVVTEAGRRVLDEADATYATQLRESLLDHFSGDEVQVLGGLLGRPLPDSSRS